MLTKLIKHTAWWAPVAVLVLHRAVMWLGLRPDTDWLLHLSGGLAITLFLWSLMPLFEGQFDSLSRKWRLLLTFFSGCTVALIWDLIEFASDEILGTDIQHSLRETMLDLSYGFVGVTTITLALILLPKSATKEH